MIQIEKVAGQEACVLGVRERGLCAFEAVLLREVIGVREGAYVTLFFGDLQGFVFRFDLEDCRLPLHVGAECVQVKLFDIVFERFCLFLQSDLTFCFANLRLQDFVLGCTAIDNRDVDVQRNAVRVAVLELASVLSGFPGLEAGACACAERDLDGLALACNFGVLLCDLDGEAVRL